MTKPTTTHASWGAGRPHLIITGPDGSHREHVLEGGAFRIGSGADSEIRVEGIETLAAEIRHDENDEFVYLPYAPGETNARLQPMTTVGGQDGEVLRTGARFTLGDWTFVFARDEFADHGRPYGGRQGGEGTIQPTQPPRPDYSDEPALSDEPAADEPGRDMER